MAEPLWPIAVRGFDRFDIPGGLAVAAVEDGRVVFKRAHEVDARTFLRRTDQGEAVYIANLPCPAETLAVRQ